MPDRPHSWITDPLELSPAGRHDLAESVANVKAAHDGDVVVHGSAALAQALIENDLVDALHLMVFPVVLGEGKRLFGPTSDKKRLRLTGSQSVGDGVLILAYERG